MVDHYIWHILQWNHNNNNDNYISVKIMVIIINMPLSDIIIWLQWNNNNNNAFVTLHNSPRLRPLRVPFWVFWAPCAMWRPSRWKRSEVTPGRKTLGKTMEKLGKTLGKHRKTEETSGDLENLWSFSTLLDNFAGFHQGKLISARKLDVDHWK